MTQAHEANREAAPQQPQPLRLSRVFHARRETVFKAWSSADHVKRWFCPETFTIPDATVEMRVGGSFDVCMRSPAGEQHWLRGKFVEVTPHTRLVIDMNVADRQIVELVSPGDLVITADIPLAADVVAKGGQALNPRGELYTEENIGERLVARNLLDGLRGAAPADIGGIAAAVVSISQLATELGSGIEALDVNPLLCGPDGVVAVDVLVVRSEAGPGS